MRQVEESDAWKALKKRRRGVPQEEVSVEGITLDLSDPCIVLGGRNGSGKSRLLRSLAAELGQRGLFIDLHSLCEQALSVLRSRDDFEEMKQEYAILGPDGDRRGDVERIVGRDYAWVDWYALEIEPGDPTIEERFRWSSDQTLIPYFETEYRHVRYTSRDMGLGEFSVHFLFWIMELYRGSNDLTLLIDEPDAYLPPVASFALLARLQRICLARNWRVVLSTHSSEIIEQARRELSLIVMSVDAEGVSRATHCRDDPSVGDALLARPVARHELFVEDESAFHLARALIATLGYTTAQSISLVWGRGSGYMIQLQQHLPMPVSPVIRHAFLFDGDQRGTAQTSPEHRWTALFLPTHSDPDTLFKRAGQDVQQLATRLGITAEVLSREIESHEGMDAHDWVNGLATRFGRAVFLQAVADLWVEQNAELAASFCDELREALQT